MRSLTTLICIFAFIAFATPARAAEPPQPFGFTLGEPLPAATRVEHGCVAEAGPVKLLVCTSAPKPLTLPSASVTHMLLLDDKDRVIRVLAAAVWINDPTCNRGHAGFLTVHESLTAKYGPSSITTDTASANEWRCSMELYQGTKKAVAYWTDPASTGIAIALTLKGTPDGQVTALSLTYEHTALLAAWIAAQQKLQQEGL